MCWVHSLRGALIESSNPAIGWIASRHYYASVVEELIRMIFMERTGSKTVLVGSVDKIAIESRIMATFGRTGIRKLADWEDHQVKKRLTIVHFESISCIKYIVVRVVPGASIIVVETFRSSIVCQDEVFGCTSWKWREGRFGPRSVRQKGHSIPAKDNHRKLALT